MKGFSYFIEKIEIWVSLLQLSHNYSGVESIRSCDNATIYFISQRNLLISPTRHYTANDPISWSVAHRRPVLQALAYVDSILRLDLCVGCRVPRPARCRF